MQSVIQKEACQVLHKTSLNTVTITAVLLLGSNYFKLFLVKILFLNQAWSDSYPCPFMWEWKLSLSKDPMLEAVENIDVFMSYRQGKSVCV